MYAIERASGMELSGRGNAAAFTFKGSEIVGAYRNEIVFNPHMNDHERLVMNLQALNADLVSKAHVREQMGVADNDAMVEEIYGEKIEAALLDAIGQSFLAAGEPTPEGAVQAEAKVAAFIDPNANGVPHPLLSAGQAPPMLPTATPGSLPGGPPPAPPGGPLPPGPPTPGGPPAPSGPPTLAQVQTDMLGVRGLQGRAFLIGEIVQRGSTDGPVEVAVTERADEQTLTQALPQYHFSFTVVAGEPNEENVEVTTGVTPKAPTPEPVPTGG